VRISDLKGEIMKVIAINGSPRKKGNTSILIQTVFEELNAQGIETAEINVGVKTFRGCMACMKCAENLDGHCIIKNDNLNDIIDKMREADGIILGSPVYCADLSGQMKTFIDRVSLVSAVNGDIMRRKVGAAVMAVRRAGALSAFHSLNSFFTILEMVVVGSSYWNMGFGHDEGEVKQDEEGLQTMSNLGKNMAWLIKSIDAAKKTVPGPETIREARTNFIH
jgi:multimeric flavodoxin WrbA